LKESSYQYAVGEQAYASMHIHVYATEYKWEYILSFSMTILFAEKRNPLFRINSEQDLHKFL